MYTAADARNENNDDELDDRIRDAVRRAAPACRASIRIYVEDSFAHRIESELQARGFFNIDAPSFTLKCDVSFEWE